MLMMCGKKATLIPWKYVVSKSVDGNDRMFRSLSIEITQSKVIYCLIFSLQSGNNTILHWLIVFRYLLCVSHANRERDDSLSIYSKSQFVNKYFIVNSSKNGHINWTSDDPNSFYPCILIHNTAFQYMLFWLSCHQWYYFPWRTHH